MVMFSMRESTQPALPSLVRISDQSSRWTGTTGSSGFLGAGGGWLSAENRVLDSSSQLAGKPGGGPFGGGGTAASFLSFSDFLRLGTVAGLGNGGGAATTGATRGATLCPTTSTADPSAI